MPSKESDLLKGVLPILNETNLRTDINYDEIISELTNDSRINTTIDPVVNFRDQLKSYAEKLNLPFDSPVINGTAAKSGSMRGGQSISAIMRGSPGRKTSSSPYAQPRTPHNTYDYDGGRSPISISAARHADSSDDRSSDNDSDNSGDDNGSRRDRHSSSDDDRDFPNFDYSQNGISSSGKPQHRHDHYDSRTGHTDYSGSSELYKRTEEETRHNQIRSVMKDMGGGDGTNDAIDLEPATREDEKIMMLEEIDFLWATLEEEEAPGLDKMRKPTENDSYEKVEAILRRLRLKNDRQRYTSFADEFILWGADGLEELFDGKRTYFGRYRPDLRGWRKEVQVKLRRMKHDTSTLVSYAMSEYNIGPAMRIFLELVPNAFMYARRKKTNYGKPNVFNANSDISEAINNIRDME